ncbi:hypothetical protein RE628_23380 [Paenibacillus sp. D2_2]|uniref:hypothetical protein n=1 Tax=Paenibacillus sp. D2_2 TaxID=3073092 RepID=UPI0028161B63|nr:hypothetical protein [Paenibacillus sp. D2_2]WMT40188.1 hypothetical protein RE628_23380 [Paenibacillus sp. D2_2]
MSILRLISDDYGVINSRFIQAFDLELCNLGNEGFEMLITVYTPQGLLYRGLYHLAQGVNVVIPRITTQFSPFQLIMVTNINQYDMTAVTLRAWNGANPVAIFTQEEAVRIN